ncbi:MAG TPA: tripartite tricarboxylate transporter TctB family protein [Burkholderiales bacterium]|nr:tripartite tricarboxylate transporter TctB family protein [Burkholderiales bacterium]
MSEQTEERPAFRTQAAELGVAGVFLLLGAIVIFDSVRLGARWGANGPQPGYFPFYLGLLICFASAVNLGRALTRLRGAANKPFVGVEQLKLVLAVLVPSAVYVGLVGWLGIYVSSILFVGFFMRWLGKYAWWKVAAVSLGNSLFFYLVFEVWFKIPLPKGPIEALLGLD